MITNIGICISGCNEQNMGKRKLQGLFRQIGYSLSQIQFAKIITSTDNKKWQKYLLMWMRLFPSYDWLSSISFTCIFACIHERTNASTLHRHYQTSISANVYAHWHHVHGIMFYRTDFNGCGCPCACTFSKITFLAWLLRVYDAQKLGNFPRVHIEPDMHCAKSK